MALPPSPRDRLLHVLKTRGPRTAAQLAARLGVTATAVRQHLEGLSAGGLVTVEDEARSGVGRPARRWRVTEAADGRFPDGHADLAVEVIGAARAAFGEAGVERLVEARTRQQIAAYRERVPGPSAPLGRRVAALARLRREEGYLAESRRERDGSYTLVENHCPICVAARACQGLCGGELELFRAVLGKGVTVERTEHLLAGARRCAYRVVGG